MLGVDAGEGALVGQPDRLGRTHSFELLDVEVGMGKFVGQLRGCVCTSAMSSCRVPSYSDSLILLFIPFINDAWHGKRSLINSRR